MREALSWMNRAVSIRARLTALTVLATLAPVGTALVVVAQRDLRDIRNEMVTSSALIGYVIAEYSASAMAFEDRGDAARTLNGLTRDENVIGAALYDGGGHLFTRYERRPPRAPHTLPETLATGQPQSVTVGEDHVVVVQPVVSQGTRY